MSQDLFADNTPGEVINIAGAQLLFFPQVQLPIAHDEVLARLIAQVPWVQEDIIIYGKRHPQPRLIAWYGDEGMNYRYSGVTHYPLPWSSILLELKHKVEALCGCSFNSALVNYYRHERDSMGMHSDDERELGPQPVIASLSLGGPRTLIFKPKRGGARFTLALPPGSLLVMQGDTQKNWLHGINKETTPCAPRVNITFRRIIQAD
ncbi:MAG TPA: alpha-ketoglutarate-dependent dioxygenase AlkB [Cellvibrionaceae bacterium]|nr:alpha-ketoglutarate-dependent dioxygenase AlkB [Cellvibrionaceae bacterium]HMW72134.1 alpha-ketoglutarate-dependent dioxygenase AlkB [Cellvibrionaceae bacterium]HMY40752.1 alpha-ketoglutarate-dependent dioxygenase AlkB [Marinagarivorans sp.]HNG61882.1 alpha-ketoglutarate-dependent dioxygenase AlkB [Cellvibrionaceae bacterium]